MSRIPPTPSSSSRSPSELSPAVRTRARPSPSPTSTPRLRATPSLKILKPPKSPGKTSSPLPAEEPPKPKVQLSIKEQIALKRAEAKKAASRNDVQDANGDFAGLEDAIPVTQKEEEDSIDLGRWSVKETIERARNSGAINLASRALPCLPSALFEIHLGITPEALKSVPKEPPITTSSSDDASATRRKGNHQAPSWYEQQDLEVLKAWSNEIVEIQPEISMFGSLKTVDLHNNRLVVLPDTFADLTALTTLDLSHNQLKELPSNLFALPNLATLNISHNSFTALSFRSPFATASANPLARTKDHRGDWFSESITRATIPLPRLISLDASYNYINARDIDHTSDSLPTMLSKLDLSGNPLGESLSLVRALARLGCLRELRLEHADIADDSFPPDLFSAAQIAAAFPALKVLDLGESHVTRPAIEASFVSSSIKQELELETTREEPRDGVLRVVVGKKVIKEAWEVEAERKARLRTGRRAGAFVEEGLGIGRQTNSRARQSSTNATKAANKEAWELEAEQGLLTEGARRRARAATTARGLSSSATSAAAASTSSQKKQIVEKEAWEVEAEQGMLTAGAQRRARAAAALVNAKPTVQVQKPSSSASAGENAPPTSPASVASVLSSPQFHHAATQALTLPPSAPPSKAPHARSISLAAPSWVTSKTSSGSASDLTLAVPTPTLPLAAIAAQPLAQTLKILILANRRKDTLFSLPSAEGASLPHLEELSLEGCNLADSVPVMHASSATEGGGGFSVPRVSEPLLPLLARLFPSLRTLDLSYNTISSSALTRDALSSLILANEASQCKGLRHLRLRGNRITELDGFQGVAELFSRNRDVPEWKLEELDLRDNEISKLPPELGLLHLDVFLVDGNVFRVPPRRVWEREGTKGLLSWLRGRIE